MRPEGVSWKERMPGREKCSASSVMFIVSPPRGSWVASWLDLRVKSGAENKVRDIAYDRLESVSLRCGELLPLRVVAKEIPFGIEVGGVGEAEHIGKARH